MMDNDTPHDQLVLHALADGELDPPTALALERRLAAEPRLAADYAQIVALKAATKRLGRPVVSDAFADKIAMLAAPRPRVKPGWVPRRSWLAAEWRAIAASLVVTACLASGVTYTLVGPQTAESTENAIVDGHRRALLAASPIDIASSDRHTVRPWFDAKLGLSPPTPDLAAAGFPLVGGRVDVVANRPVPSLVYRRNAHLITVLAIPNPAGETTIEPPVAGTAGGYNLVRWRDASFSYWVVSDLDTPELGQFVGDLRAK